MICEYAKGDEIFLLVAVSIFFFVLLGIFITFLGEFFYLMVQHAKHKFFDIEVKECTGTGSGIYY